MKLSFLGDAYCVHHKFCCLQQCLRWPHAAAAEEVPEGTPTPQQPPQGGGDPQPTSNWDELRWDEDNWA